MIISRVSPLIAKKKLSFNLNSKMPGMTACEDLKSYADMLWRPILNPMMMMNAVVKDIIGWSNFLVSLKAT